ncbi:hypothetical protein ACWD3J_39230 [Streptomyces sp. NPDC002755]
MSKTALIVIDMIDTYGHPDVDLLLPSARKVVPVAAGLLERARRAGERDMGARVGDSGGLWT